MREDFSETDQLSLCNGSTARQKLLGELFTRHRKKLRTLVALRLDQRLQGRIDPSDVVQEAFLEAARRLEKYLKKPPMPLYFWLRRLTGQKLMQPRRFHL